MSLGLGAQISQLCPSDEEIEAPQRQVKVFLAKKFSALN